MLLSLKFLKISWSCLNALSEVKWQVAQYQEQHAQGHLSFTKSFISTSLLYYAMKTEIQSNHNQDSLFLRPPSLTFILMAI